MAMLTPQVPCVCIVIPTWNLCDPLLECLHSLTALDYSHYQVVVVDNASTDGTGEAVENVFPDVHIITNDANRGYAGGLNVGIRYALENSADYVLALNNDTIVEPTFLNRLVQVAESDGRVGIVSPKVLDESDRRRIQFSLGERVYGWSPVPLSIGHRKPDGPQYSGRMEFDYVSGCAILIKRRVFEEIGLFDTSFFMYYEDADFCRRARDRGYRILCVGDAIIWHKTTLSGRQDLTASRRVRARSKVKFYRRYRHGPHPVLTYLYLVMSALVTVSSDLVAGRGSLVMPYLRGWWEGWQVRDLHQITFE